MNSIEDRLAAAARAVADVVPDGSAPPLRLPVSPARSRRNLPRLLTPFAAAAAIVAISITTAVVIRAGSGAGRSIAAGVGVGTWTPGPVPRIPAALERTLPRFYLTQWRPTHKKALRTAIAELRTGATIAIRPPQGYQFFDWAAAVGDRTFALAAMQMPPRQPGNEALTFRSQIRLYLVDVDSSNRQVTVTEPHIAAMTNLVALALSPSGSEVAVAQVSNIVSHPVSRIRIYSRTGELLRQWQSPGFASYGYVGEQDFSWASNGDLAFSWESTISGGGAETGVWMLDSNAPSGSLLGHARLAVPQNVPDGFLAAQSFALPKGGTRIATGIQRRRPRPEPAIDVTYEFDQFSASTGKLITKITPDLRFYSDVLWSNESGSEQIVAGSLTPGAQNSVLGVLAGTRFVPFAGSPPLAGGVAF
jgi:hypothetical protein